MRAELKNFFSIHDKLLKNVNDLKLGTSENQTTAFLIVKKAKKEKKRAHVFKNYAPIYNAEILNYFNPEPQLKNNELRGIKFVIALVFILKKTTTTTTTKEAKIKQMIVSTVQL